MKFNDLTSEVARRLPGSVGAAQVNQIAKVLLDILCFFPDDEILSFMNRRKKAIARKIMKREKFYSQKS